MDYKNLLLLKGFNLNVYDEEFFGNWKSQKKSLHHITAKQLHYMMAK